MSEREEAPGRSLGTLNLDGRNIDPGLGALRGEGAGQLVRAPIAPGPERFPTAADSTASEDTYYGLPILKETVWKAGVPIYFYVGGLAGASAALGAAAQLRPGLAALVRRTRFVAAAGAMASAGLLIEDLGRPTRFLNMLRVVRLRSPMSVGSWILTAFGALSAAAAAGEVIALPDGLVDGAGLAAGLVGLPLAGYTAVLLASTAVPVWQGARTTLPPLFLASAAASAASALDLMDVPPRAQATARRFGLCCKAAELLAAHAVERELSSVPSVVRTLGEGLAGTLWRAAKLLTAVSLIASAPRRRPRWLRVASGLCGTAGGIAHRFAIFQAGRAAARNPRATFDQHRGGVAWAPERGAETVSE